MPRRGIGFVFGLVVLLLRPWLMLLTRRKWAGASHLPGSGPVIIVGNHISWADPLTFAHFIYDAGRLPRFLGKVEVFRVPVVGWVIRQCGQIPVSRFSDHAADALIHAQRALEQGEAIVIYPEGTITKDPDYWPMAARTGAARLALATGAPVIPIGQWGAQDIIGRDGRLHLLPRKTVSVLAGPAVDLTAFRSREPTPEVLAAAIDAIMDDVTCLVAQLRGMPAPPRTATDPRFDGRHGQ